MLDEVESKLRLRFESQDHTGEAVHEMLVGDILTRVVLRLDRKGVPVLRYWFGQSRVDRQTFQTLTCLEIRCPRRQAMLHQWQVHAGLRRPARPVRTEARASQPLAAEERIRIGEMDYLAREARFPMTLKCGQQAHGPVHISVSGWDVFSNAGYVAGGWSGDRPMFETLDHVRAWLNVHQQTLLVSTCPV